MAVLFKGLASVLGKIKVFAGTGGNIPSGTQFRSANITMYQPPAEPTEPDPDPFVPYVVPDAMIMYTSEGTTAIHNAYLAADMRLMSKSAEDAEADYQSIMTMVQGQFDSNDEETIRSTVSMYLGAIFSSLNNIQSAIDAASTEPYPNVQDAFRNIFVLAYTPVPQIANPDQRGYKSMSTRLIEQATIPLDSNVLSIAKIKITSPDAATFPWSAGGADYFDEANNFPYFAFNKGYSWRGVSAYNFQFYSYTLQEGSTEEVQIPESSLLQGGTPYMPYVRSKRMVDTLTASDTALVYHNRYNSKKILPIKYLGENLDILLNSDLIASEPRAQIWIQTDQPSSGDYGEANRQIFAGEGGVPYQILESRTYQSNSFDVATGTTEYAWAPDGVAPAGWDVSTPPVQDTDEPRVLKRNKTEFQTTTGLDPDCAYWAWTQAIKVISKEEWPDQVEVTFKDANTQEIVSNLVMQNIKDNIQIDTAGNTAWFNSLHMVEFAEDRVNNINPYFTNYGYIDDVYYSNLPYDQAILKDVEKWAVDPWTGVPFKMLPGSGTEELIMEIKRVPA